MTGLKGSSITVVIPTYNRRDSLGRTLTALGAQTYPPEDIEVVVVADGCTDGTVEMLRHSGGPFTLRVLEQQRQGAATARNNGAAHASGRLLLFLDDDIEAAPSLVMAHVHAHENSSDQVVIGQLPPIMEGPIDFHRIELRTWWVDKFQAMREEGHRFTYRDLLSGNFSLPAELFARTGGFNVSFSNCSGEDYEFGARLLKAGITFKFCPEAFGYHHENTDLKRSFRRKYHEGRGDLIIARHHPELLPVLLITQLEAYSLLPGRILRALAFGWPAFGDFVATIVRGLLDLLEWARLRGQWRHLLVGLYAYWYWRGVANALGSQRALAEFLEESLGRTNDEGPELEIDLRDGLAKAEQQIDSGRPAAIRIRFGHQLVGCIPQEPGAERLRATHLRPFLVTTLAEPLLFSLAVESMLGASADGMPSVVPVPRNTQGCS